MTRKKPIESQSKLVLPAKIIQAQQPVTNEMLFAPWKGTTNGEDFWCDCCGYRFALGDTFRMALIRELKIKNPYMLICNQCDNKLNIFMPEEKLKIMYRKRLKLWFMEDGDYWNGPSAPEAVRLYVKGLA